MDFSFDKTIVSSKISRLAVFFSQHNGYSLDGVLWNEHYGFKIPFASYKELFLVMDQLFDYLNFPQASHGKRVFSEESPTKKAQLPFGITSAHQEEFAGKQPDCIIQVQFRQNSTWQGIVEFGGAKTGQSFASELELTKLLLPIIDGLETKRS